MHHRAKAGYAFPPLPVALPFAPHGPLVLSQQPTPQGLVIHHQLLLGQIPCGQRRLKVRIPLGHARQNLRPPLGRLAPLAKRAAQPMHQPGVALVLIPSPHPSGLPIAQAQHFRGFHQA